MDKDVLRSIVWDKLIKYAKPDSRFHYNFSEFIPDFEGSDICADVIRSMDLYKHANILFITPDNCLEDLRMKCIIDKKNFIMPTYGIRRGFVYLDRKLVPEGKEDFASKLDGAEIFGRYIDLKFIEKIGKIDLMITGASIVSVNGVRYGKGHGYFDLEWAMMREIGVVDDKTPIMAVVHDCQVLEKDLSASKFDTIVDYIITPSQVIKVTTNKSKPKGIDWNTLDKNLIENIPPLKYLYQLSENI